MSDSLRDADAAARSLIAHRDATEAYDLMYAIGKANATEHRALIESFLDDRADPMRARLALQILCDWWGFANEYREQILRFTKGVDWDLSDGGFVQLVAITVAGELIRSGDDPALLGALVSLYDSGADDVVKGAVYAALARWRGIEWAAIPRAHRETWRTNVDETVLDAARRAAHQAARNKGLN